MATGHGDDRAIVHPHAGELRFRVARVDPHPDLVRVVAHHWTVRWDVGDAPYAQEVIAHPNVQVAAEWHEQPQGEPRTFAEVHGVVRGTFRRELRQRGRVHGIKFRAGTFRAALGEDVSTLTDRVVPAATILGISWPEVARAAVALDDDRAAAALLDEALLDRLPTPDPAGIEVADLVERIAGDRSLDRVDQLAALAGVSLRTLQRSFSRHVGVGPKRVVRTFRLHEVAQRLAEGEDVDLAELAARLRFSDQAHLTHEFRRTVGHPPGSYAAQQRRDREALRALTAAPRSLGTSSVT